MRGVQFNDAQQGNGQNQSRLTSQYSRINAINLFQTKIK